MNIVDQIRETLDRKDGIQRESLEPLVAVYSDEVAQLNQRLTNCSVLLRRGLRSEAIQQANMRPNLLDWSARLDFPELEEWTEILMFYELPVPTPINRSAVQQIQEALVEEQPLAELLRQHRRMAIAKAPLAWRLKILRSIAKVDSLNPVWSEDIEKWEKARLAEIPRELQEAQQAQNYQYCKYLAEELSASHWMNHPPQPLIATARSAADGLEFEAQCVELREIGQALSDAFCAHDESAGMQHRDAWNSIVLSMKREPRQDLLELVEPAFVWLADVDDRTREQATYGQSLAELEALLERPGSIIDIQNAFRTLTLSGRELPFELQQRVDAVLAELRLAEQRRSQLRIVSLVSLAVLLLVAFGIWQWRSIRSAEIERSVVALSQMLSEGRLDEAEQFVNQIADQQPYVLRSVELQALTSELNERRKDNLQRREQFESLMTELEATPPEQIDLGLLIKAESLTRSEAESSRAFKLRRSQQEAERRLESEQSAAVRKAVERIAIEVDGLEGQPQQALNERSFDSVLSELDRLKREFPRCSATSRELLDNLQKRAKGIEQAFRAAWLADQREAAGLKRMRDAISLQSYQQSLQGLISGMPSGISRDEYDQALDEQELWTAVEKWNGLCSSSAAYTKEHSQQSADELWQSITAVEANIDLTTAWTEFNEFKQHVDQCRKRSEALDKLLQQFKSSIFSTLYTLETIESKSKSKLRYFAYARDVERDPVYKRSATAANIEVVSEANGAVRQVNIRPPIDIIVQPKRILDLLTVRVPSLSEQIVSNWEREILNLISLVLQQEQLDASVAEKLILMIVESGMEGSNYLTASLRNISIELKERQAVGSWVIPTGPSYQIEQVFLSRMKGTFSDTYRNSSNSDLLIRRLANSSIDWVGHLYRDHLGNVVPWLSQRQSGTGKLLVIVAHPTRSDYQEFQVVAELKQGDVSKLASGTGLMAGRPLFLVPTP